MVVLGGCYNMIVYLTKAQYRTLFKWGFCFFYHLDYEYFITYNTERDVFDIFRVARGATTKDSQRRVFCFSVQDVCVYENK